MSSARGVDNNKGYQNTNIDTGITGLGGVDLADGAAGVTQVETAVNAELADVKALKQTHVEALDTMIANAPKKKLYGSIDGGPINAQNLTITDDWNGNPSYVISIPRPVRLIRTSSASSSAVISRDAALSDLL